MADYSDASYSTLVEALKEELGDAIPSPSLIPRWIRFAEVWCERNLDLDIYDGEEQYSIAGGSSNVDLPEDFGEFRLFYVVSTGGTAYAVDLGSRMRIVDYDDDDTGVPEVCWVDAQNQVLQFRPAASESFTGYLFYKRVLAPLSYTNDSNDLLRSYFDLLFYRTLIHAAPYLYEDDRVRVWGTMLNNLVNEVEMHQWRRRNQHRFKELRTTLRLP